MDVEFLKPAQAELIEAVGYYNAQKEGLGFEFAEEVKETIERIIQYPEAWSLISQRTRRCRTKRFPYGIIYQIRGNTILVIAVMHLHREPRSWRGRVN
ncbi:MAG: type II toxin-antitoxin system RelE/ParE family toxin [bacterium]